MAIFAGHVMKVEDEPEFSEGKKDFAVQIDEHFVIGTKHEGEIEDTDIFNHSCNPNAGFKGQIFLVAMRDIPAGEEVTFDYAMVLHEAAGMPQGYEFACLCGSS
ncbi:MAG: SET domain-containing protein, partial [Proteobacteria bacterium]|nr:SET domain-containing protein [Pseudomonadota bacterium]